MIEPVEAELARPPIFTSQQEHQMQETDGRDLQHGDEQEGTAPTSPSDNSANASTLVLGADAEKGKGEMEVDFGPGENPKEWSKAKKWYVLLRALTTVPKIESTLTLQVHNHHRLHPLSLRRARLCNAHRRFARPGRDFWRGQHRGVPVHYPVCRWLWRRSACICTSYVQSRFITCK
jgi:hypothetical protein